MTMFGLTILLLLANAYAASVPYQAETTTDYATSTSEYPNTSDDYYYFYSTPEPTSNYYEPSDYNTYPTTYYPDSGFGAGRMAYPYHDYSKAREHISNAIRHLTTALEKNGYGSGYGYGYDNYGYASKK